MILLNILSNMQAFHIYFILLPTFFELLFLS